MYYEIPLNAEMIIFLWVGRGSGAILVCGLEYWFHVCYLLINTVYLSSHH